MMVRNLTRMRSFVPSLLLGVALLACPVTGSAGGRWSVITLPQQPGEVINPAALAADATGDLYVADESNGGQVQKRDAQGNWSAIVTGRLLPGQAYTALAVDTGGNLYVAGGGPIQKRDAAGSWSVIAMQGTDLGQVSGPTALATDGAGNLYVADYGEDNGPAIGRVQERDTQGHWSLVATGGIDLSQITVPSALAVDVAGNLYVASRMTFHIDPVPIGADRIQERDIQGSWTVIAGFSGPLAVDSSGSLYVGGFEKRDVQGNWSDIPYDAALGQVGDVYGLAVDGAGNLYVADSGNNRVLKYTPGP